MVAIPLQVVKPVAGFDPVLISLIRRSMPNLVAYDLAGVQPMSGPTGLIFAMRSKLAPRVVPKHCSTKQIPHSPGQNEGDDLTNGFSDGNAGLGTTSQAGATNPAALNPVATASSTAYNVGQGMRTDDAEDLGHLW